MTYLDSASNITITHDRAIKELRDHGLESDINYFYEDLGKRSEYSATDVLEWLGY